MTLIRHRRLIRITAAIALCASAVIATGCKSTTDASASTLTTGDSAVVVKSTGDASKPLASDGMLRGSLAYPTGDRATSSLLLEKAVPAEIVAGKPYDYELKVTNLTRQTLENVEIVESVPAGMKFGDKVDGATLAMRDNAARIGFGSIKPGESKTVKIPATATAAGAMGTCAAVSYATNLCLDLNVVSPSLKVEKALPPEILVCNSVPLSVKVTNSGTGTAKNVKLTETLSDGFTTAEGKGTFDVSLGDIAAGQTKSVDVPLKLAKVGSFNAITKVSADDGLAAESTATTVARQPVLVITKRGPEKQYIGVPYTYDITVKNTGDAPAANLVVTDTLPAGLVAVSATDNGAISPNQVVWNLGVLEKGGEKALQLTVRGDNPGAARNSVGVTASCAEPKVVTADTSLVGVPAVLVEVVDEPDPVRVGDQTTYTIRITNQGSAPQTNVEVTAELEQEMEAVTAQGTTPGRADGLKIAFDKLATLAPRAKAEWTVTVKAKSSADVRFKVKVLTDQIKRPVNEEESTNFYQ
jgi:uncharacterized repeat protein (TIGR01451 family)